MLLLAQSGLHDNIIGSMTTLCYSYLYQDPVRMYCKTKKERPRDQHYTGENTRFVCLEIRLLMALSNILRKASALQRVKSEPEILYRHLGLHLKSFKCLSSPPPPTLRPREAQDPWPSGNSTKGHPLRKSTLANMPVPPVFKKPF